MTLKSKAFKRGKSGKLEQVRGQNLREIKTFRYGLPKNCRPNCYHDHELYRIKSSKVFGFCPHCVHRKGTNEANAEFRGEMIPVMVCDEHLAEHYSEDQAV